MRKPFHAAVLVAASNAAVLVAAFHAAVRVAALHAAFLVAAFHAAVLVAGICLALPALAQDAGERPQDENPAAEKPRHDGLDKVGDTAERMVTKPLKDLNLLKDKIPPEVQAIMDRPYDISRLKTCADRKQAVARLTELLGPDVDSAQAQKKGDNPAEFALGAAESVVGGLIPGMGLVRKITGAEAAEKRAKAAVLAGQLRRAYIKGAARAKGCKV